MTEHYVRPDVAQFLQYLNTLPGPKMHELPADAARAVFAAGRDVTDLPVGELAVNRDISIPGPAGAIPARLFDSRASRDPGPVMVFFHGGGFVVGNIETHAGFCAEMARVLDIPVVSVDYRLAPEHPFPAAPDDCEAAARWVAASPTGLGLSATSLVLSGDSAGGALTIVTAMALRDAPAQAPVIVQFPIYPTVDEAGGYASFHDYKEGYLLTRDGMLWFNDAYRPDSSHWRGAPLKGHHHDMPSTLVITAGLDPLRDQGRAYAAALIDRGIPTVYREAVGTIHGFVTLRKAIPSSRADVAGALAVLKAMIVEAEANRAR